MAQYKKDARRMVKVGQFNRTFAEMSLRRYGQSFSPLYITRPRTEDDAMQLQLWILRLPILDMMQPLCS
jgi:hypothetical protein